MESTRGQTVDWDGTLNKLVVVRPNRSLNLTAPRAGFSVRREYSQGPMLVVTRICGNVVDRFPLKADQPLAEAPNR